MSLPAHSGGASTPEPTQAPRAGLVSVIVPTHDTAASIEAAVDSILSQTHSDLEVIVVDDCSTDGTAALAEQRAAQDARVHLIRRPTCGGAQAARNAGIEAARGAWIAFLDSDDTLMPSSLQLRLERALEKHVEVVHSACLALDAGSDEPHRFEVPSIEGAVYADLLRAPAPAFPAILVSREALERIGTLDETLVAYQEWDTSIRLAEHHRFAYVDDPTFVYDRRSPGAISRSKTRAAEGYEQVVRKHRSEIVRQLGSRGIGEHYRALSVMNNVAGRRGKALKFLLASTLYLPMKPGNFSRKLREILRAGPRPTGFPDSQ